MAFIWRNTRNWYLKHMTAEGDNPNFFAIMLGGNHAYKRSMEIDKGVAILRRVGTHKELGEKP